MAAALYMRGIPYVQMPTTLLAQVDSSVGGKTAVNLRAGKNLAGVFHQPSLVLADTSTLATLPDDEFRSGLGEVIKTAMLASEEALAMLESESKRIWSRDPAALEAVVEMCVRTKAIIVSRDPHEKGPRKLLNLGHTFAHAIEHDAGFGKVPHGVAVGVGLRLALDTSHRMSRLADPALPERVDTLLQAFGMPRALSALKGVKLDARRLVAAMSLDKKNSAGKTRLVLPVCAGQAIFDVEADEKLLFESLEASLST
jgi:3-dehydroquinate synthase